MIKKSNFLFIKFIATLICISISSQYAYGQWKTQSITLLPGWNGVYLHVDPSHQNIGDLDGLDPNITDIWLWKPKLNSDQFIQNPDIPTDTKSRWVRWNKDLGPSSALQRLVGNAAYLVKYGLKAEDGTWAPAVNAKWDIKGIPAPPNYSWTSTGFNFFGLAGNPDKGASFEKFFPARILNGESPAEFYTYRGEELSDDGNKKNPAQVVAKRNTPVVRGEAFWMRVGDSFNSYFGSFDLVLQETKGAHFGETKEQYRILIRNRVEEALSVTMALKNTEEAPSGQPEIKNGIKVLVKGEPSLTDLTYGYKRLEEGPSVWTLSPAKSGSVGAGSSQEIIIGIDRHNMDGEPGDLFGGILEFTDSLGLIKYEIPVSALIPANSGLWVGSARVGFVRHDITFFRKKNEKEVETDEDGKAISEGNNDTYGAVGENYPLRFIFHRHNSVNEEDNPKTMLYQRLFFGLRKGAELATDFIITNDERALDKKSMDSARRVASANLPWSKANAGWECSGDFDLGKETTVKVNLPYNDRVSNPFIHAYHPDHDNLDAKFKGELNQGYESWGINREMTFRVDEPNDDFNGLVSVGRKITGEFHEKVELTGVGVEKKAYHAKGIFELNRISESNEVVVYDDSDPEPVGEVPDQPDEEQVDVQDDDPTPPNTGGDGNEKPEDGEGDGDGGD